MDSSFPVVVMDFGGSSTHIGLSGNRVPSASFPTAISYSTTGRSSALSEVFSVGHEALAAVHSQSVHYPVSNGIVTDWSAMEDLYTHSFYQILHCPPERATVLLTDKFCTPRESRETVAEIFFESLGVPGLSLQHDANLSLWTGAVKGSFSPTGLVVDCSHSACSIVPIGEGVILGKNVKTLPLGGRHITESLLSSLKSRDALPSSCSIPLFDLANRIKEQFCYFCSDASKEKERLSAVSFDFQDPLSQKRLSIPLGDEIFRAPSLLFAPQSVQTSLQDGGLAALLRDCLESCPIDLKQSLSRNIVLSGGTSCIRNFKRKLKSELDALDMNGEIVSHPYQAFSSWLGGSLLASMAPQAFQKTVCTKKEYEEVGPQAIHQRS